MSAKRWPSKRRPPLRAAPSAGPDPAIPSDYAMIAEQSAAPLLDADADCRASARVRRAASMLRRGDDVDDVAMATDVPVALLDLLRAEVNHDTVGLDQQRRAPNGYARRRRRVVITVLVVEIVALANIVVGVIALIGHDDGLGLLATVIASALVAAVYAVATYALPTGSRLRHPRFVARRTGRDRGSG